MGAWTTRADVVARLRRRWDSGEFLATFASGAALLPIDVPLRGPGARDVASNFAVVRDWVQAWRSADGLRVEYQPVGGRVVGANELPRRVWVDDWPQLWALLGVGRSVRRFTELLDDTCVVTPALAEWMLEKPHEVLALSADWRKIVDTVRWIDTEADPGIYLRQVDLPGVDTKFIERHQKVLSRLLDRQLDPARIDFDCPPVNFIGRYKFRRKPRYVRFRWLDPTCRTGGFTELTVRADELAAAPLDAKTVVIVENETTYLALPPIPDAVAIFGGGYSLTRLDQLGWLGDRTVRYWGDIDTHGFVILDRLRSAFPHVGSVLMDRETLLAHEEHWVAEKAPVAAVLDHLRAGEAELYRDLVEETFGRGVRLEQERIRYSVVEAALAGS
ncbi:Wadjet anti-phage system protein JetD domain-containing protein [Nocardia sp. NPDC050710]|uniref:Wadjet anti-phage system protein JetD domain-containing protein n=1 Tax=Nocardia sp. NPDC050710 TaxID=3157220 RepID=UPI0033CF114A